LHLLGFLIDFNLESTVIKSILITLQTLLCIFEANIFMASLKSLHLFLIALFGGLFMVLAFPFTGSLTPLVFVGLVPLLVIEDQILRQERKGIHFFLLSYLYFFIFNVGTTYWIYYSTDIGSYLAFIFNSLLMAGAFQTYHLAKKYIGRKQGYVSLIFLWVGFEYCHFNWELSWPWLSFGNFFSIRTNWVQWYEYTGVLGGTLWVILVNLSIFLSFKRYFIKAQSFKSSLFVSLLFLSFPIVWSYGMLSKKYKSKGNIHTVVVQPNIDPYNEKFDPNVTVEQQLAAFFRLADLKCKAKTRLIIGPETAISQGFFENELAIFPFYRFLLQRMELHPRAALLIGASTAKAFDKKVSPSAQAFGNGEGYYESYNTSLFLDTNRSHSFVHKSKLVLGVEKIPFSSYMPFLESFALENGGTSGTLGVEKAPKNVQDGENIYAPIICYESIYGDFVAEQVRNGAEMLCIITNDGWWRNTAGYKQHFSFARLRAIENRRWVARSANTGISGFIDEKGNVQQTTSWWKPEVIEGDIPLITRPTIYTQYGDYIGRSFAFVAALVIVFSFKQKLQRRLKR
jgi:apolipoprotein N-acyltransferase